MLVARFYLYAALFVPCGYFAKPLGFLSIQSVTLDKRDAAG